MSTIFRVPMNDGRSNTFLKYLEQVINESNPALVLCVIPSTRGDIYSLIKRKLCIDRAGIFLNFFKYFMCTNYLYFMCIYNLTFSVPSQIVLLKTVQKNNLSICTKIAIQINCKLGGAPWLVNIPKKVIFEHSNSTMFTYNEIFFRG